MKVVDVLAEILAEQYRKDFFSGVDIDLERRMIIWIPSELKANIFEILGTTYHLLNLKYLSAPRRLDENKWCAIISAESKIEDDEIQIFPSDLEAKYRSRLLTAFKTIKGLLHDRQEKQIGEFDIVRNKPETVYIVSKRWKLIFHFADGVLVLSDKDLFDEFYKELLRVLSR